MPGFPNFFMLYGPGTNGGEIVIDAREPGRVRGARDQAAYAAGGSPRSRSNRGSSRVARWLQSKMRGTSWTMSNNYFTSPTGKVVTQWPYGNVPYRVLTKLLGRVSETTR